MSIDSDPDLPAPIDTPIVDTIDTDAAIDAPDEEPKPGRPPLREHWIMGPDPFWGAWGLAATTFCMLYYFVHLGHLTSDIHRGYGDSAFDIGLYDQGLWLLSRFHAPFITEMGRNLFGDHTQFLLLTLVPFYWIRPDATTLLWIQAAVMAAGAIPVYLLAMRRLSNPLFATVLAAAFLLHPALAQTNLEN